MEIVEDYLFMSNIVGKDDGVEVFKSIQKHGVFGLENSNMVAKVYDDSSLPSEAITAMVLSNRDECKAISADIVADKTNKLIKLILFILDRYKFDRTTTVRDLINSYEDIPNENIQDEFLKYYESNGVSDFVPYIKSVDLTEEDVVDAYIGLKYNTLGYIKHIIELAALVESLALQSDKKTIDISVLSTLVSTILKGGKVSNNFADMFGKLEDEEDGTYELEIHGAFSVTDYFKSKSEKAYHNELELKVVRTANGLAIKESEYEKDVIGFFQVDEFNTDSLEDAIKLYNTNCPDDSSTVLLKGIYNNTELHNNLRDISKVLSTVDKNTISKLANDVSKANGVSEYDALTIVSNMLKFVEEELLAVLIRLRFINRLSYKTDKLRKTGIILNIYREMLR